MLGLRWWDLRNEIAIGQMLATKRWKIEDKSFLEDLWDWFEGM